MAEAPGATQEQAVVKAVKTKPHKVLSNLKHDGKLYRRGSVIDLSAKHAKSLIERKVVSLIPPPATE